jgi:hypothetical protein
MRHLEIRPRGMQYHLLGKHKKHRNNDSVQSSTNLVFIRWRSSLNEPYSPYIESFHSLRKSTLGTGKWLVPRKRLLVRSVGLREGQGNHLTPAKYHLVRSDAV